MLNNQGEDITELCVNNYNLLKSVVSKYVYRHEGFNKDLYDDLLSYCTPSYLNACVNYNVKSEYKFSTFATKCIENKIGHYNASKYAQKRNFNGTNISLNEKCNENNGWRDIFYEDIIKGNDINKFNILLNEINDYVFNSGKFNNIEKEYYNSLINGEKLQDLAIKLHFKSPANLSWYVNSFRRKINCAFNPNGELFTQIKL